MASIMTPIGTLSLPEPVRPEAALSGRRAELPVHADLRRRRAADPRMGRHQEGGRGRDCGRVGREQAQGHRVHQAATHAVA